MSSASAVHLARAKKAAGLLVEASSQEEAALLIDAGLSELSAAIAAAPVAVAERVQRVVNEIAEQLLGAVHPAALAEAVEAARS